MASSLSRERCSQLRIRWSSARRRRFATFMSKIRLWASVASPVSVRSSTAWVPACSIKGRQETPRTNVSKASFSSLSSRHSRRAAAREPSLFTKRMVGIMPPSLTRRRASSKSEAPLLRRRASSTRSRASCCMAKMIGAEIRPSLSALRIPTVRTSFSSPTTTPMSDPNSAICCAISSLTLFTKAAQAVDAPKKAATPATCSISRYSFTVRSRFQSSSRFRSWPSLYDAMVFAMSFRHCRE
mmetsp:Transcript_13844/g.33027  ORF Transcript_13844/g.33027 Transcript_13844/m.33027 type:complete len:241 (-) Transcript_13844:566-1288(-)